jgi:hypothetical protein
MDAKLVQALRVERDRLREQVDLIDKLLASHSTAGNPTPERVAGVVRPRNRVNGGARPETKESLRTAAVTDLLKQRGSAVHRKAIFDHLTSLGIAPPSIGQLAPFLSNHKEIFVSDKRGNYRLAETAAE